MHGRVVVEFNGFVIVCCTLVFAVVVSDTVADIVPRLEIDRVPSFGAADPKCPSVNSLGVGSGDVFRLSVPTSDTQRQIAGFISVDYLSTLSTSRYR